MQTADGRWLVISTVAWLGSVVPLPRWTATTLENGRCDIAGRLSGQFADWLRALATPAEAAAGAELVHCLGIDRELPHLAGDAASGTLVQTLAELTAKGQRDEYLSGLTC